MENKNQVWHYTAATRLVEIISSGEIKLGAVQLEKKERPSVWVSSNPVWENTATKMVRHGDIIRQLTLDEMKALFGLARIEVKLDNSFIPWAKFKKESGISSAHYSNLERAGCQMGANPKDWYAAFHAIKMENWISIEVWQNSIWVKYNTCVA